MRNLAFQDPLFFEYYSILIGGVNGSKSQVTIGPFCSGIPLFSNKKTFE